MPIARIIVNKGKGKGYTVHMQLDKEAANMIEFNPIIFNTRKLQIKRPTLDCQGVKELCGGRISLSLIHEHLEGDYELIKENEDLFTLELKK